MATMRLIDANKAVAVWEYNLPIIKQMDTNGNMQKYIKLYEEVIDFIKECPTVDAVEVVHGRWINPYINRYGHPCHCCSICGFKASYQDKNYCPNCGAKMDGDGNG